MATPSERLLPKILKHAHVGRQDECWPWQGAKGGDGRYGIYMWQGRIHAAHRLVWMIIRDFPLPVGMKRVVMHTCDNSLCVNPEHLVLGTPAYNMRDCARKHRTPTRLTEDQVSDIRRRYSRGKPFVQSPNSATALAREFGVSESLITGIIQRTKWAWM